MLIHDNSSCLLFYVIISEDQSSTSQVLLGTGKVSFTSWPRPIDEAGERGRGHQCSPLPYQH